MTALLISGLVVVVVLGAGIVWLDRKLRQPVFYSRVAQEVAQREARKAIAQYDEHLQRSLPRRMEDARKRCL